MPNSRNITFVESIREATQQLLQEDQNVYVIGEGVTDPKAIFGTTKGLLDEFGPERVFDMPVSENGLSGICIGSAIQGMKPILVHQRIDFTLYSFDQIINNAAKWYSMFGGQKSCPFVNRMIIGQGWGQGNQHSQNLQNLYAHVPGLKVVMPSNAYEAKGLLISAVRDPNPVIFIEHRWLHNTTSDVPEQMYEIPIGQGRLVSKGDDITVVTWSYWTLEALNAKKYLEQQGINIEIIDIRSLSPLDIDLIKSSVKKTKNLLVVDGSWKHGGFASEIVCQIVEDSEINLMNPPKRLTFPNYPSPSTPGLTKYYYPTCAKIFDSINDILRLSLDNSTIQNYVNNRIHDIPDKSFTGPF